MDTRVIEGNFDGVPGKVFRYDIFYEAVKPFTVIHHLGDRGILHPEQIAGFSAAPVHGNRS